MTTLKDVREAIDALDDKLVDVLHERAALVLKVKELKKRDSVDVYSPEREREIFTRVRERANEGAFPASAMEHIFTSVVSATRSLMGTLSVVYPGPELSLGYEASLKQFGESVQYFSSVDIRDIVRRVEKQDAHFGLLPIEVGTSGLKFESIEAILASELAIIAEVEMRRDLSLMGTTQDLSQVRRVYADLTSFEESSLWLSANLSSVERVVCDTVADAAQKVQQDPTSALIGTERASEMFKLTVIARSLLKEAESYSRFLIIGPSRTKPSGHDKTSIVCTVTERSGILRDLLTPFAERDVSLLKIESKLSQGQVPSHRFFFDVLGHRDEKKVKEAIESLGAICNQVRVLGSYPIASSI